MTQAEPGFYVHWWFMPFPFRHAICNEVYDKWDFREACQSIRRIGYEGIEIAPFTLAEDPRDISPAQRKEYSRIIGDEGLEFVGLHWLMVSPKGLHVTTPDRALRTRSWEHIHHLIDLCADLGPNGLMVFGSPAQRRTTGDLTRQEATRHYVEGLAEAAPHAAERGVSILVEALPVAQSDVVQTLEEAVSIVREIDSPAVRTMYDSHNAVDEVTPHEQLVDRYFDYILHVHVNEMDGRHPGTGDHNFKPVLDVLHRRGYDGWISLEAFDFSFGSERISKESLEYMRSEITSLQG